MTVVIASTKILSDLTAFKWGCVGGLAALLVSQVLPVAIIAAKTGRGWTITVWRVVGVIIVFAIYIGIGGVVAIAMGDATKAGQAIVYGIGSQAIFAGIVKTGKAVTT